MAIGHSFRMRKICDRWLKAISHRNGVLTGIKEGDNKNGKKERWQSMAITSTVFLEAGNLINKNKIIITNNDNICVCKYIKI